jgi:hypothetical protein
MVPVNLDDGRPSGVSDRAELVLLVGCGLAIGAHPQVQRDAMALVDHHDGTPLRASITFLMWFLWFHISTIFRTCKHVSGRPMISVVRIEEIGPGFLNPISTGYQQTRQFDGINLRECAVSVI